jgi:transcriptional regulator with XRE-family HTH domain
MSSQFNTQIDLNLLGRRIMKARKDLGLSLTYLGERVGVHYTQISRIERGDTARLGKNMQKICKYLNIEVYAARPTEAVTNLSHRVEKLVSEWPESEHLISNILDGIEEALKSRNA